MNDNRFLPVADERCSNDIMWDGICQGEKLQCPYNNVYRFSLYFVLIFYFRCIFFFFFVLRLGRLDRKWWIVWFFEVHSCNIISMCTYVYEEWAQFREVFWWSSIYFSVLKACSPIRKHDTFICQLTNCVPPNPIYVLLISSYMSNCAHSYIFSNEDCEIQ